VGIKDPLFGNKLMSGTEGVQKHRPVSTITVDGNTNSLK